MLRRVALSLFVAASLPVASVVGSLGCGGSTRSMGPNEGGLPEDAASTPDASEGSDAGGGSEGSEGSEGSDAPADGSGAASADSASGNAAQSCPAPTEEAGPLPVAPTPICSAVAPASPVIATFDGASSAAFAPWGTAPLVGGVYVYPACTLAPPEPTTPLFADYSASDLHVTGTVGSYAGFGFWWVLQSGTTASGYPTYASGLLDVSAYDGIQFDIRGNPGPLGALTFAIISANQQSADTDPTQPSCGTCDPEAGACDEDSFVPVVGFTTAPTTVRIRWSDLSTTIPFDPSRLAQMGWFFPWIPGGTPYAVDLRVDNVQWLTDASDAGAD